MSRIEVLSGPERRRRWTSDQKRSIVAEAFAAGASVCEVARRMDEPIGIIRVSNWRPVIRSSVPIRTLNLLIHKAIS
jgi:transposase